MSTSPPIMRSRALSTLSTSIHLRGRGSTAYSPSSKRNSSCGYACMNWRMSLRTPRSFALSSHSFRSVTSSTCPNRVSVGTPISLWCEPSELVFVAPTTHEPSGSLCPAYSRRRMKLNAEPRVSSSAPPSSSRKMMAASSGHHHGRSWTSRVCPGS